MSLASHRGTPLQKVSGVLSFLTAFARRLVGLVGLWRDKATNLHQLIRRNSFARGGLAGEVSNDSGSCGPPF